MAPNENRRAGEGIPSDGGMDYDSSSNSAKVIRLPVKLKATAPFDRLTAWMVIAQHRAGTLPEGVLVALLAGAGLRL
jgi:hypothetical protein